jgi:REP-associated tyrosine transposase
MPDHMHGILVLTGVKGATKLGEVIRSFKAASSRRIHRSGFGEFAWQHNFYEHVVRSYADLNRIREYVRFNALKEY